MKEPLFDTPPQNLVLIETLWNVNVNTWFKNKFTEAVLIETLWNVNGDFIMENVIVTIAF